MDIIIPVYQDKGKYFMITKQGTHVSISHVDYTEMKSSNERILKMYRKLDGKYTSPQIDIKDNKIESLISKLS